MVLGDICQLYKTLSIRNFQARVDVLHRYARTFELGIVILSTCHHAEVMYIGKGIVVVQIARTHIIIGTAKCTCIFTIRLSWLVVNHPCTSIVVPIDSILHVVTCGTGGIVTDGHHGIQVLIDVPCSYLTDVDGIHSQFVVTTQLCQPVWRTPGTPSVWSAVNS